MSCLVALRLLIRSVLAHRVIYSSWISYPTYLLLYHMLQWANAKPTQFQAVWTPLTLARTAWQPGSEQENSFFSCKERQVLCMKPAAWNAGRALLPSCNPSLPALGEITSPSLPAPFLALHNAAANKWVSVHLGCPSCWYCLSGDSSLLQHLTNSSQ